MRLAVDQAQRVKGADLSQSAGGAVIPGCRGRRRGHRRHRPVGGPHAEVIALHAAGSAPRAAPPSSRSSRATTTAAPALRRRPAGRRGGRGGIRRRRSQLAAAGETERLRAAGVTVTGGVCADEDRRAVRASGCTNSAPDCPCDLEIRDQRRRPQRRRRRLVAVDHRRGRPRRRCTAAGPPPTPSWWAPGRCSPTTHPDRAAARRGAADISRCASSSAGVRSHRKPMCSTMIRGHGDQHARSG